jgi:hypothetical protein
MKTKYRQRDREKSKSRRRSKMKQEKKGKEKIRLTGSRSEIVIKNIQKDEMRDTNKIEDDGRSIKKWNNEERNV